MRMIWGTVRRGSITLAGTCLALDLTGFSATAVAGRNGAGAPAAHSNMSHVRTRAAVRGRQEHLRPDRPVND